MEYCCSLTQLCPTLCDPDDCSTSGFSVFYHLPELAQTLVPRISDAIQPSQPLSSPSPPVFPSIRVFSNDRALHIRWQKYWSLSFSISPSNEYSGLISFRIDWFNLLAVQGRHSSHSSRHAVLSPLLADPTNSYDKAVIPVALRVELI